jgi:hypothetical protein
MKLYHYCSVETGLKILESKTIHLSSLSTSNDSGEGKWALNEIADEVGRSSISSYPWDLLDSLEYFAFCLSTDGDSVSQWFQYASAGQGICIAFDSDNLRSLGDKSSEKTINYWYDEINYGKKNKKYEELTQAFKEKNPNTYSLDGRYDYFFSIKNPSFSNENEYRLNSILHDHSIDNWIKDIKYKSTQNSVKSYLSIDFKNNLKLVTDIILGPKNITEKKTLESFLHKHDFKHVCVSKSKSKLR